MSYQTSAHQGLVLNARGGHIFLAGSQELKEYVTSIQENGFDTQSPSIPLTSHKAQPIITTTTTRQSTNNLPFPPEEKAAYAPTFSVCLTPTPRPKIAQAASIKPPQATGKSPATSWGNSINI
jgi:hypothetical protein